MTATDLNVRVRHYRRSGGPLDPALFERIKANPPRRYLAGPLESWCQDWLQYGELTGSIGYLRILREYSYAPSGRFEDDSLALTQALDSIMPRVARLRGLVVDMRMNGGGFDAISLPHRLPPDSERLIWHSANRPVTHPEHPDRFTPLQAVHVRASSAPATPAPSYSSRGPTP